MSDRITPQPAIRWVTVIPLMNHEAHYGGDDVWTREVPFPIVLQYISSFLKGLAIAGHGASIILVDETTHKIRTLASVGMGHQQEGVNFTSDEYRQAAHALIADSSNTPLAPHQVKQVDQVLALWGVSEEAA